MICLAICLRGCPTIRLIIRLPIFSRNRLTVCLTICLIICLSGGSRGRQFPAKAQRHDRGNDS